MRRLKQTEIKAFREELLELQGGVCALCGLPLDRDDAVLDHSHCHGWIRGVLHRGCNSLLGKVENNYKRYAIPDLEKCIASMWLYIACGNAPAGHDVYHPSYRTEEEKRLLRNKRARRKRKAKKAE